MPFAFAAPLWLAAGLAACLGLGALFLHADRRRARALAAFAAGHLLPGLTASFSPARRRVKRALLLGGIALLFVALARPQAGFRWEETRQRGVDVLFLVDTSKSMLTQDVKPDRLTRAKLAVDDLADRLDGDRLGLIAFAGDAFLQCPLTLDAGAFRESVDALDTATIPRGGTNISSALREAVLAFHSEGGHAKIAVLLTDGEDLEGSALDAAKEAAKAGLKVYTVGVGTPAGELIPVPDAQGGTAFVRDGAGQIVKSRLDEDRLRRIAAAAGGTYQPLGARGEGLDAVFQTGLAPLPRDNEETRKVRVPLERFAWPLGLGLLLLLAEPLVGTRRRTVPTLKAGIAALLALCLFPAGSHASPASAERAFDAGDYARAEQEYDRAARHNGQPELQFDLGASAYKNQRFDKAADAFQKTLKSDRLDVQQQAYYNLGNTLYRLGEQGEKANPQQAMAAWQKAVEAYDGALKLHPHDADAQFNRDFVAKKLQQLQKQNPQKQNQDKKDQKDQQDQKNQPQAGQGNPQNGGQSSESQPPPPQPQQPNPAKPDQGANGNQQQPQPPPQPEKDKDGAQDQKPQSPSKPSPDKADKPQPKPGEEKKSGQEGNGLAPVPGQMTPEDAKNLLDSLRGDEKKLPLNDKGSGQDHPPEKDW